MPLIPACATLARTKGIHQNDLYNKVAEFMGILPSWGSSFAPLHLNYLAFDDCIPLSA
jgi:hypothetical protein